MQTDPHSIPVARGRVAADVVDGLGRRPRRLSGKYLWDTTGSDIFDRICGSEDYYLPRLETALIKEARREIAELVGPGVTLVEYGSGASRKVRMLLDVLDGAAGYVPIDIAAAYLAEAAERIARAYPQVPVTPLVADYTEEIALPASVRAPLLGFFPGSTIGNFAAPDVVAFLARIRRTLGDGRLLIGHDPNHDPDLLRKAYGRADGLMAALHLNMLRHLGRLLGVDVDQSAFRHEVRIETDPHRVEAHLVATREVALRVDGRVFEIAAGESIHTDTSYKMEVETFLDLAARAGWAPERSWRDGDGLYALHLLRPSAKAI